MCEWGSALSSERTGTLSAQLISGPLQVLGGWDVTEADAVLGTGVTGRDGGT